MPFINLLLNLPFLLFFLPNQNTITKTNIMVIAREGHNRLINLLKYFSSILAELETNDNKSLMISWDGKDDLKTLNSVHGRNINTERVQWQEKQWDVRTRRFFQFFNKNKFIKLRNTFAIYH